MEVNDALTDSSTGDDTEAEPLAEKQRQTVGVAQVEVENERVGALLANQKLGQAGNGDKQGIH
jgi:hypothetical protein